MRICKNCRDFFDLFNNMFKPEKYWFFEKTNKYMGKFDTIGYCKSNFLDNDNKVKSCLLYYHEKLGEYLHKSQDEYNYTIYNGKNTLDRINYIESNDTN